MRSINNQSANHLRYPGIDALRGVAALLVVWLHSAEQFVLVSGIAARGSGLADAAWVINAGRVGVIAFFAISGFVIVPTLTGSPTISTKKFMVKRFFRLYPAYWLSIIIAVLVIWKPDGREITASLLLANLTMIPVEFGQNQVMGNYWTLEVELIFYVLIVLLFLAKKLESDSALLIVVIVISLGSLILDKNRHTNFIVQHNFITEHLSYFLSVMFWGAMIRRNVDGNFGNLEFASLQKTFPLIIVTAIIFIRPFLASIYGNTHVEDWRGALLGIFLFLCSVHYRFFYSRALVWLGAISYSVYLFHPLVFYSLFRYVNFHSTANDLPLIAYVIVSMVGSIAIGSMIYVLVERPSNVAGQRILRALKIAD